MSLICLLIVLHRLSDIALVVHVVAGAHVIDGLTKHALGGSLQVVTLLVVKGIMNIVIDAWMS